MKKSIIFFLILTNLSFAYIVDNEQKYQLIIFEGSDWCSNCIRLEKNILSNEVFIDYLKDHDIELLRVDFPQRKKIDKQQRKVNEAIAEKYEFQGVFPSIILSKTNSLDYKHIKYNNQTTEEIQEEIQLKLEQLK